MSAMLIELVSQTAAPLATVIIARVTTKGIILRYPTAMPLNAPIASAEAIITSGPPKRIAGGAHVHGAEHGTERGIERQRQVDTAADHHHRHPDRHHGECRSLNQDVDEVVELEEGGSVDGRAPRAPKRRVRC